MEFANKEVVQYLAKTYTQLKDCEAGDVVLQRLATPPQYTTLRINTMQVTTASAIDMVREELTQQYYEKGWSPPDVSCHPQLQELLVIQNAGPFGQNDDKPDREIVVDRQCGMAVLRGADVFVQGIMAAPPGLQVGERVAVYSDVKRCCMKGLLQQFDGPRLFVGCGEACVSRNTIFKSKGASGVGVSMRWPVYRAPMLSSLLPNIVFPQNLPSALCSRVLDPQPGDIILDLCASPGGKTTHIATLMGNQGRVVALDKGQRKVERVLETAAAWGLSIVEAYPFDARFAMDTNADASGGPPYPPGMFDRVLVDAPCSGLGQRPAVYNTMTFCEVSSYPSLQKHLLDGAVSLLRPGGTLVYSTCTIPAQENEQQVAVLLQEYQCLDLQPQVPVLGGPGLPGHGLTDQQRHLVQRFDPAHPHHSPGGEHHSPGGEHHSPGGEHHSPGDENVDTDTIGFFMAKFIKNS